MLALTPTLTGLHFLCFYRSIIIFQITTQLVLLSPPMCPAFWKVLEPQRLVVWTWSGSSRRGHLNTSFPAMFGKGVEAWRQSAYTAAAALWERAYECGIYFRCLSPILPPDAPRYESLRHLLCLVHGVCVFAPNTGAVNPNTCSLPQDICVRPLVPGLKAQAGGDSKPADLGTP